MKIFSQLGDPSLATFGDFSLTILCICSCFDKVVNIKGSWRIWSLYHVCESCFPDQPTKSMNVSDMWWIIVLCAVEVWKVPFDMLLDCSYAALKVAIIWQSRKQPTYRLDSIHYIYTIMVFKMKMYFLDSTVINISVIELQLLTLLKIFIDSYSYFLEKHSLK